MKAIFCDFDGVVTAKNGTPGSYMTHDASGYGPTPECVGRLVRLAERAGAKIVMSSNWRKFDKAGPGSIWRNPWYGDIPNPLPGFILTLGDLYLESLPPVRRLGKAALAEEWLARRPEIDAYVALDDQCGPEGFCSSPAFVGRYICTDPETGLTDDDCDKALCVLT